MPYFISWNELKVANFYFQVVAFILIGVAVYGKASALGTNIPVISGILACGVFLFLVSILGLIGAVKHHQVILFFVSFISIKMNRPMVRFHEYFGWCNRVNLKFTNCPCNSIKLSFNNEWRNFFS